MSTSTATRVCARCKESFEPSEMCRTAQRSDGVGSYCRPCDSARKRESDARIKALDPEAHRERQRTYTRRWKERHPDRAKASERRTSLRRKFGITPEEYDALLEAQAGVCAICGEPPGQKALAVDHDHDTGSIRGLLCGNCNTALGLLSDDVERLIRAIIYVEDH